MTVLKGKPISYLLFFLLILSLFSGIISTFQLFIVQETVPLPLIIAGFLFLFILSVIAYIYRSKLVPVRQILSLSERKFLIIAITAALCISLISILAIDTKLFGDFLAYHRNAVKICDGKYSFDYLMSNLWNLYLRRPLVNLVPVYSLFGKGPMVFQVYNAILHALTGLMLYFFVKDAFRNTLIARFSLIFFFSVPIAYLTMNIPSHDIPGLFYLMLSFLVFVKLEKKVALRKNIFVLLFLSLSLGIIIFILNLSRSLGPFYFYALFISLIIYLASSVRHFLRRDSQPLILKKSLLLFILPLVTYYMLSYFLISGNLNSGRFIMAFIATDTSEKSVGAYSEIDDYKRYYSLINRKDRNEMSVGKLSSELYYNYYDFLKLLIRKNNRLYQLGDDYSWTHKENISLSFEKLMSVMWGLNKLARIFLFFFAITGLVYLFKKYRLTNPFSLVVLNWMICSLLLIMIGEVSPRYSYLFLITLPVLAATGFLAMPGLVGKLRDTFSREPKKGIRTFILFTAFVLMVFILLAGFGLIFKGLMKDSNLIYRDLRTVNIYVPGGASQSAGDGIIREVYPQEKPLKFGIKLTPGLDSVAADWKFEVQPGASYEIRGFIRENNLRPDKAKTLLFANHIRILPEEDKLFKKGQLKISDDYSVRYFSYSPIYVENNTMTIHLVIDSGEGGTIKDGSNGTAIAFLEFLQVVKIDPEQKLRIN